MKKPRFEIINLAKTRIPSKEISAVCSGLFQRFSKNPILLRQLSKNLYSNDLTLVFLTTAKARSCNKLYRGKDYATDVLSFAFLEPHRGLGELVFCTQVLKRQAKEHGISFKNEIVYLVIHGFLHLLGYDHDKSRKDELAMMRLQDLLFEKLR